MGAMASQITSPKIVYSTVNSGADQSKHQSWVSLAFVWGIHRWPVNSPHKWPVARKMFPFDDVIMMLFSIFFYILSNTDQHVDILCVHLLIWSVWYSCISNIRPVVIILAYISTSFGNFYELLLIYIYRWCKKFIFYSIRVHCFYPVG